MKQRAILVAAAVVVCWPAIAVSALIVNPPRSITHRVTVQIIQTALTDGTSPATVFGNATQRAAIEAGIDEIWAQAGIDVHFLPNLVRYNNTFAYQGNSGSGTRSTNDLGTIINNARNQGGILHSDPQVLDTFFVNVAPGFAPLSQNTVAGLANVARDGIAAFVGSNLLTFPSGRDVISSVIAHEIGHNLGLNHTPNGQANLMSPNGTSAQLTQSQITTVFQDISFVQMLPAAPQLMGDFNGNGIVDAADYVVWRNTMGQAGSSLTADGDQSGVITTNDYHRWRANFGKSSPSGSGSGGGAGLVPESATLGLAMLAAGGLLLTRRRAA